MTPAELDTLVAIAHEASELVRGVYERPFAVEYKAPRDPVTEADRAANDLICARLAQAFPGIPIVAEESAPESFADFRSSDRIFFVDPVDGTNEFVDKNGEFVVMLALVEGERATAGVLAAPATGHTWVGHVGRGAYRLEPGGARTAIRVTDAERLSDARVVSSRSHRTPALERVLASLGVREILTQGSAGLKGARVAEGSAELYVAPHYAGKRWDVAASEALVIAAGGGASDAHGDAIDYRARTLANDRGFVASNGRLHAAVIERLAAARSAGRPG